MQTDLILQRPNDVMSIALAIDADRHLQALGVASTLDRFAGLGHSIDARVVEAMGRRRGSSATVLEP